jgi:hypothetical protein
MAAENHRTARERRYLRSLKLASARALRGQHIKSSQQILAAGAHDLVCKI